MYGEMKDVWRRPRYLGSEVETKLGAYGLERQNRKERSQLIAHA